MDPWRRRHACLRTRSLRISGRLVRSNTRGDRVCLRFDFCHESEADAGAAGEAGKVAVSIGTALNFLPSDMFKLLVEFDGYAETRDGDLLS